MSLLSTSTFAPEDEGPFYIFERYEVLKKYDRPGVPVRTALNMKLVSGLNLERGKLFFLGQLAVSYAGLADFFSDVSYQAEDAWLEEISKSSEERWHKDQCREYLLPDVPGKAH